jgi:hypothetical protein
MDPVAKVSELRMLFGFFVNSLDYPAIAGEIVDSRSLTIFFSGSSKLLNLIVSALCT